MGFIADIFTADKAADAQKDVSRDQIAASNQATDKTLALQKDIFERIWGGTQVQRDAGDAATRLMSQIMGLNLPAKAPGQPAPQPATQPTLPGGAPAPQTQPGLQPVQNALARSGRLERFTGEPFAIAAQDSSGANPPPVGQGAPGPANLQINNTAAPAASVPAGNALAGADAAPFDVTAWLRSTPGYEANYASGMRALNTGLASQGRLFSGDAGRESQRYGQEYADRTLNDQFNRLAAIAGAGQTATSQGGQAGQNYANQSGGALMQNAANLSSSYQNRGNAISGFWGDMGGTFGSDAAARMAGSFMKGGF